MEKPVTMVIWKFITTHFVVSVMAVFVAKLKLFIQAKAYECS